MLEIMVLTVSMHVLHKGCSPDTRETAIWASLVAAKGPRIIFMKLGHRHLDAAHLSCRPSVTWTTLQESWHQGKCRA